MTLIQRIEDLVQRVAPLWSTVHVVPRGTPRMMDPQLRGTLRYGQRLGSYLPNIQPHNRVALIAPAQQDSQTLALDRIVDGIHPGSLISIDQRDLQEVFDVDIQTAAIQTTTMLKLDHDAGAAVDVFATQLRVVGPFSAGQTQLQVRGPFKVLPGDRVWIQADQTLLGSGIDYRVLAITSQYTQSLDLWNSTVELEHPLPRDLTTDDIVYLRGYPGYLSNVVGIPLDSRGPYPLGPFVVDHVSGRLSAGNDVDETLSLQRFDFIGNALDLQPYIAGKNTPVCNLSIHQSSFLFWRLYRGTLNYRDGKLLMRADSQGRFQLWTELVPPMVGPVTWSSRVTFNSGLPNKLFVQFHPSAQVLAGSGAGGASQVVDFTLPAGESTRITLTSSGPPNAEIEMGSWNVAGASETYSLQYGLMAVAQGPAVWQSGSLMIKPYFKNISSLALSLDLGNLDSGALLL